MHPWLSGSCDTAPLVWRRGELDCLHGVGFYLSVTSLVLSLFNVAVRRARPATDKLIQTSRQHRVGAGQRGGLQGAGGGQLYHAGWKVLRVCQSVVNTAIALLRAQFTLPASQSLHNAERQSSDDQVEGTGTKTVVCQFRGTAVNLDCTLFCT